MDSFKQELDEIKPTLLVEAVALYEKIGMTPMGLYEKCCDIEAKIKTISDICFTFNH